MKRTGLKRYAAVVCALSLLLAAGCSGTGRSESSAGSVTTASSAKNEASTIKLGAVTTGISAEDLDIGYDESESVEISFDGENADISGSGAELSGGAVTISSAGTYVLRGSGTGRIVVDAGKDSKVKLIMDGVSLSCEDNAAVTVQSADKVYLVLNEGTENSFSDGSSYENGEEDNTDGCIFSKADLTINGEGSLSVSGNFKHGIVSKDDLVVTGGNISVYAVSSALVGKDSLRISSGSFDIECGKDGLKSTNTEKEDKGFISITGGTFDIVSGGDAVSAATDLIVSGGEFELNCGGGSANASMKTDGRPNDDWQNDMGGFGGHGGRDNDLGEPPGGFRDDRGDMGEPPDGFGGGDMGVPPDMNGFEATAFVSVPTVPGSEEGESTSSAKGLKAGGNILVEDCDITADTADDLIHCGGDAEISGGTLTGTSGDDGIHVDGDLLISGGEITISKSYEGIEGMTVTVTGGKLDITASDDGINCAGGSDTGSEGRMGWDQFAAQEGVYLRISGGEINVNSGGDGLDSNGDLYIDGGFVTVSGPENSGNGSIDHNGSAYITGGTVIALGAVGMEEMFDEEGSSQYAVLHDFAGTLPADTEFTVSDRDGNVILSFISPKTWQGAIFSSPDLEEGQTYTLTAGSYSDEVSISSVITSNSSGGFGGGNMGPGGARGDFGRKM